MEPIARSALLRQDRHYGTALITHLPVADIRSPDLSLAGR